jgi:hypothetical protein
MAIYGSDLTFKRPTKAQVPLTDDLLSVIQLHHRKSREHLFHLCMIAYGLRTHNLTKPKSGAGGNVKGYVYKAAFKQWYEANLDDVYGTLSNFTHYAMAGRLLEYVRWQIGQKYIAQLPSSMTALYALSQIVWSQGDTATPDSRKLFDKALKHPIKDGTKHNAFIHPHVSREDVHQWHHEETGKAAPSLKVSKLVKKDPRTVVVATIKVHKNLFKFTRTGEKLVGPKLSDVKDLTKKLQSLIDEFGKGKVRFALLESNIDQITQDYKAAENPDYGKEIIGALPTEINKVPKKTTAKKA